MQQFGEFLASAGRPLRVQDIRPDDIRVFQQALFGKGFKSSTVNNRHRGVQSFFKWLTAEEELDTNPMLKVAAPQIKEVRPLVIVSDQQWQRLLRSCEGKDFTQRRACRLLRSAAFPRNRSWWRSAPTMPLA